MKIGQKGIDLIKKWESLKLKSYLCSAKVWTIGWGHTKGVKPNQVCTREQADKWFMEDVTLFETFVNKYFSQALNKLTQNQFDALVSLCYNIGPGNLYKSPVLKGVLIDPNDSKIASYFLKHIFVNATRNGHDDDGDGLIDEPGEVSKIQGLINRRNDEIKLYFSK